MRLVTGTQMREIDAWAIGVLGIPGPVLMENAGACVTRVLLEVAERGIGGAPGVGVASAAPSAGWPAGLRVAVLCGKGNNGGDGFVVARRLANLGIPVRVFIVGGREGIGGDALLNLRILDGMPGLVGIETIERPSGGTDDVPADLSTYDLVVDALLGTGFSGEVREPVASVIRALNRARGPRGPRVVAVDVPSGLDSSTGLVARECVRADVTVTFAYPKMGLVTYPGAGFVGDLYLGDIGIPRGLGPATAIDVELIETGMVRGWMNRRAAESHKGTHGHVVVVAGSSGLGGAASLCSEAALRAGAGLVTLAVPKSLAPAMEARLTEVMKVALPETALREQTGVARMALSEKSAPIIIDLCRNASVLAIGPGLSVSGELRGLIRDVLRAVEIPVVIDADGLNCLDGAADLESRSGPTIVTPHPGEMSRLTGLPVGEIQRDRAGVARRFARESRAVVALKGVRTVIAGPEGGVFINTTGNPGMAAAGMGDVLTGTISALLAQGAGAPGAAATLGAAATGVFLHGLAGDIAAGEVGEAGILAGDVLRRLPAATAAVLDASLEHGSDIYSKPLDTTALVRHRYIAG